MSIEEVRAQGLKTRLNTIDERFKTIDGILQQCDDSLEQQWVEQDRQLKITDQILVEQRKAVDKQLVEVKSLQQQLQQYQCCVTDQQEVIQNLDVELVGLQAQQQVQRNQPDIAHWLRTHALEMAPALVEQLDVVPGFESAVETVCAHYLQAFCLEQLPDVRALDTLSAGQVICMQTAISEQTFPDQTLLLSKVNPVYHMMAQFWSKIYVADDIEAAQIKLAQLPQDASVVTKTGLWLGHGWLYADKVASDTQTTIERQSQIDALVQQLADARAELVCKQQAVVQAQHVLLHAEAQWELSKQQLQQTEQDHTECRLQAHVQKERWRHQQQQIESMHTEQRQLQAQQQQLHLEVEQSDQIYAESAAKQADLNKTRDSLEAQQLVYQRALQAAQKTAEQAKAEVQDIIVKQQVLQAEYKSLEQTVTRATNTLAQLLARKEALVTALAQTESPESLQAQLQAERARMETIEQTVMALQQSLEACQQAQDDSQAQFVAAEEALRATEHALQQLQIDIEKNQVRSQALSEQLEHTDKPIDAIAKTLPAESAVEAWTQRIASIEAKINRLGAINLAAIDEFDEESKRMAYLQEQADDLLNALNTLEQAIAKIDLETKEKFKVTYDQVNVNFQHLFPILFHGGRGALQLTSDDLLETGVLIIARPPGKKATHIRSLSGGEKALTAIALILAIFQLNPSPFCLLDEVDAPLDDANVARFCRVIQDMSTDVQFIFITHNKITMQLADQLIGVTMNEPGVSRLVAVDMATALAQANS